MDGDGSKKRKTELSDRHLRKLVQEEVYGILKDVGDLDSDDWLNERDRPGDKRSDVTGAAGGDVSGASGCDLDADFEGLSDENSTDSGASQVCVPPTRLSEVYCEGEEAENSSSDEEHYCEAESVTSILQRWYVNSNANLHQLRLLLEGLRPFHKDLPKDPRTIVRTPRCTPAIQLNNGSYVHLGLKEGLLSRSQSGLRDATVRGIEVKVNVDGMKPSNDGYNDVWPILGRCNDFVNCKPFVVGVFCGKGKPDPIEQYLERYINDVHVITVEGLDINGVKFQVKIECYICDAPARCYLKGTTGHTGYCSCERCLQEGDYECDRVIFSPIVSVLRTEESFVNQTHKEHHKYTSPLTKIPSTKFISMFPLDPMHLIFHGVFKRFLLFFTGKLGTPNAKHHHSIISLISAKHVGLDECIVKEFQRQVPRSLSNVGKWKATELRLFLLYTGIIALFGLMDPGLFKLFLQFHVAMRILSSPLLVEQAHYVDFAEGLIAAFVKHSSDKSVFGPLFVSYNVHSMLHLCDDVRKYGVLTNFSCFSFENYLGIIKRMVRSGFHVAEQIARRLAEKNQVFEAVEMDTTVLSPDGYNLKTREYKYLVCSYYKLTSGSTKDSYFITTDGAVGCVKRIVKSSSGKVRIEADIFADLFDLYSEPISSKKLGIFKFSKSAKFGDRLDLSVIQGKAMVFPMDEDFVAMQLLHTYLVDNNCKLLVEINARVVILRRLALVV